MPRPVPPRARPRRKALLLAGLGGLFAAVLLGVAGVGWGHQGRSAPPVTTPVVDRSATGATVPEAAVQDPAALPPPAAVAAAEGAPAPVGTAPSGTAPAPLLPGEFGRLVGTLPPAPGDLSVPLATLETQADAGIAAAQYALGDRLATGSGGAGVDIPQALRRFEQAARGGLPYGAFRLAQLMAEGPPEQRNLQLAAGWYRHAAEQGQADAQMALGMLYADGLGVARNDYEAVRWLDAAATGGRTAAMFRLGMLYEDGVDGAPDLAVANSWYQRAAIGGDAAAAAAWRRLSALPEPAALSQDDILKVQQQLDRLGYDPGTPDGMLGAQTGDAVRRFQTAAGLPVTGTVALALLDPLRRAELKIRALQMQAALPVTGTPTPELLAWLQKQPPPAAPTASAQ